MLNPYGRRLTPDEATEFTADLDGLIAGLEVLDRTVLSSAGQLKAIARVGIGMDNIDQAAAADLGIKVSNTPEPPTLAVAELTVAAMLGLVRDLEGHARDVRQGVWRKRVTPGIHGAVVHLIGFGRIGRKVAELLRPFCPEILVSDPAVDPEAELPGARLVTLDEGLSRADVVSLHAAGRATVLGPRELSLMKRGAFLLNSARGELVDQDALLRALQSGQLGGAWFDAFWEEPFKGDLLGCENFIPTPHVATYTAPCRSSMEMLAAENIVRDLELRSASQ
jgi:D-3-phosphoglycerate dehydrogenase